MRLVTGLRWIKRLTVVVSLALVIGLGFFYWQLTGSLATLDGQRLGLPLHADVTITRDQQGLPTITATTRPDTAFGLGYIHAQDRFFQMDLLRRNSAGEMSALFGTVALGYDQRIRVHQFRQRGNAAVNALPQAHRDVLHAYTLGVNAGLSDLRNPPFEYSLLGVEPTPWVPADTMLVLYSMYLDLQPNWNEQEASRAAMLDLLPADWFNFLQPEGGEWDAPISGTPYVYAADLPETPLAQFSTAPDPLAYRYADPFDVGSNSWSVAGSRTRYPAAMVANDMHLGLRVPNIWYRATWAVPGQDRSISGATLPGTPAMVVGSNEHIAWAFTNSNGDYHDTILLQTRRDDSEYLTPEGWVPFEIQNEIIAIKDAEPVVSAVKRTRWGPVIGRNHNGQWMVMRWVAHDPAGANLMLMELEGVDQAVDALPIAAQTGVPGQNFVVVDKDGNQAWSIMGRLPRRAGEGFDGRLPMDWSTGTHFWNGYLTPEEYPRIINPATERIWTGNARMVSGADLERVGTAEYALGARQQQIRNRLLQNQVFTEQDFLDLQMDNQAIFLERWQALLSAVLAQPNSAELADAQQYVDNWAGRADKNDVGYWLVKRFREKVINATAGEVFRYLEQQAPNVFVTSHINRMVEYPVWQLITEEPAEHLPTGYANWTEYLRALAFDMVQELTQNGGEPLAQHTWGRHNTLAIEHPLANNIPLLGRFLKMPAEPMNGDTFMPNIQRPDNGASQRMVVAPGHEENGIFHMATGQSAHPLSPFFDRGHRDWVEGQPSPLLPGETRHILTLLP